MEVLFYSKRFYERSGFAASPVDPLILMIPVSEAARILS
jgi:hypothetical protein